MAITLAVCIANITSVEPYPVWAGAGSQHYPQSSIVCFGIGLSHDPIEWELNCGNNKINLFIFNVKFIFLRYGGNKKERNSAVGFNIASLL